MDNINYLALIKYQHKIIIGKQLLAVLILFFLLPLIASFQGIDLYEAASITQNYVSIIGLLLIGTVNFTESGQSFSQLLRSKPVSITKILLLRVGLSIFYTALIMFSWVMFLKHFNALISVPLFTIAGFSSALLWGGIAGSIAVTTRSTYSGLLIALAIYIYVVFGMSCRVWYYPLALIVSPMMLKLITVIIIFVGLIVLFSALIIDYWLRK